MSFIHKYKIILSARYSWHYLKILNSYNIIYNIVYSI